MATADVLPPDIALAQSTASALSGAPTFIASTQITKAGTPAPASEATANTATDDFFVLADAPFVDLQAYLLTALRLPENQTKFELLYPRDVFKARLDKFDRTLFDRTRTVMVDIYQHCFDFKRDTMNMMISTAGYIANFGEQAAKQANIARDALPIISAPGSKVSDPNVEKALGQFVDAVDILRKEAAKAQNDCRARVKELGSFKDLTVKDKGLLQEVKDANEKWLPSTADLNAENKAKMGRAYDILNNICKEQNKKYDQLKSTISWLGFVPHLNIALAFGNIRNELAAIDGIRNATKVYQLVFDAENTEMRTALRFRGQSKHLMNSMDDVLAKIAKAEAALNAIAGVFSKLETDLAAIDTNLELAIGHASDNKWSFQRKKAGDDLTDAGNKWIKVVDLAKRFQEKGIVTSGEIDKRLKEEEEPAEKNIDIVSTNYGGNDVTEFSQVLFRFGDSIRIRSIEPGFPDPWDRVPKTISMIHTYDKKERLFICREFSNFHILSPGPIRGYQGSPHVAVELNPAATRRDGAPIEVLAIAWGLEQVTTKQSVLDYVYNAAQNKQAVTFNNDKMGGDTWKGKKKTGTVFYRVPGGKAIYQLTGREDQSIEWPHLK